MTFRDIFLALNVLLFSCSNIPQRNIVGYYTSTSTLLSKGEYVVGNSLEVKKDSTFNYETCGEIIEGKWVLKNNIMLLYCYEFSYKNDSLNKTEKPFCDKNEPVEKFLVLKNGDLLSEFQLNGRTYKNQLKKMK